MRIPGPLSGVGQTTISYQVRNQEQLKKGQEFFLAQKENQFIYPLEAPLSSPFGYRIHPISKKKKLHKKYQNKNTQNISKL